MPHPNVHIYFKIISNLFQYDASERWFDIENAITHDQYQVIRSGISGITFETENTNIVFIILIHE